MINIGNVSSDAHSLSWTIGISNLTTTQWKLVTAEAFPAHSVLLAPADLHAYLCHHGINGIWLDAHVAIRVLYDLVVHHGIDRHRHVVESF